MPTAPVAQRVGKHRLQRVCVGQGGPTRCSGCASAKGSESSQRTRGGCLLRAVLLLLQRLQQVLDGEEARHAEGLVGHLEGRLELDLIGDQEEAG
eukprot:2528064-Prymnesium_polylepis.1